MYNMVEKNQTNSYLNKKVEFIRMKHLNSYNYIELVSLPLLK